MKRLFRFAVLAAFIGIALSAVASFSGNYLCVRRSGVTYKHKLYTATTDVGSPRVGVRVGGATRYAKLLPTTATETLYLRVRHSGTTYKVAQNAHVFAAKWGSYGSGDGQFSAPTGMAIDASGNVYVADANSGRIQKFNSAGTFLAKWGTPGSGDGQFSSPTGMAIDASGNVYVADLGNNRIQKFNSTGTFLAKWGAYGTGDGQFKYPIGVAVDVFGNVYVSDMSNNRIQKFNSAGTFLAKWGTAGSGDGQFLEPSGIAVDASGNIYVIDVDNYRIQKFNSSGTFLAKWALYTAQGCAIALDALGNVYANNNVSIFKFNPAGTRIYIWGSSGAGDGQFMMPQGIAINASENIYVADTNNYRIQRFD